MDRFTEIISLLPLKKKVILIITMILLVGFTFVTFGDSTELVNLLRLTLQLGTSILQELVDPKKSTGSGSTSIASLF